MDKTKYFFVGVLVGTLLIMALWVLDDSCHQANERWRAETAERGLAEFYLDDEQEKAWRWLGDGHSVLKTREPISTEPFLHEVARGLMKLHANQQVQIDYLVEEGKVRQLRIRYLTQETEALERFHEDEIDENNISKPSGPHD